MQVLVLNQFFWPDSAATSQLLTDLTRELAAQGCSVSVVCGKSTYAGASGTDAPAVTIRRVRNLPFTRTATGRVLSYLTFLVGATWYAFRVRKPNVILTLTTPPGLTVLGALIARLRGGRHYIWEMDVYPDIAVALGVLSNNSMHTRALRWVLEKARRHAAGVIVPGGCVAERLAGRGTNSAKIHVAENWADGSKIRPAAFSDGPLTVLYSGNLGLAHEVDTIRETILRLRDDRRFRFVFTGGGHSRKSLETFCRENRLNGVSFLPYGDLAALDQRLSECHVGLVTQKSETLGCLVPSKLYGILAAGRPVLFIGPKASTAARLVDRIRCGWNFEPGDVDGLAGLLNFLADHPGELHEAGKRGRAIFEEQYDRPAGVLRICKILGVTMEDHVLARVAGD